jgi:hypothetical protein
LHSSKEKTMTTITAKAHVLHAEAAEPVVAVKRRTVDTVLTGLGALAVAVLVCAGALLTWGAGFASDYVHDELASQNIAFPDAAALNEDGRADLVGFAGATVDTGNEAEAYASYINGHLQGIADGATYADLGTPERAANAAVATAKADGAPASEIAALEGKAAALTGQRNTLFKGETLRGLLLTAFAWSTVGRIAGIAAFAAFAAAALCAILVVLGMRHHHKMVVSNS